MSRWIALALGAWVGAAAAQVAVDSIPGAASPTELRCTKPPEGKPRPRVAAASAPPGVIVYVNCGPASAAAASGGAGAGGSSSASGTGGAGGAASGGTGGASAPPGTTSVAPPATSESGAASVSGAAPPPAKDETAQELENLHQLRTALLWGLAVLAIVLTLNGLGSLLGALGMHGLTSKWLSVVVLALSKPKNPLESAAAVLNRAAPAEFAFRRHWGSFGGESTGWNMSDPLARLLTGVLMIAIGLWVLLQLLAYASDPKLAPSSAASAAAPASSLSRPPAKPAAQSR